MKWNGDLISSPGVYEMPIDAYHKQCAVGPSVSSSGLRTILLRSPAHYYVESSLNPDREEPEEKEAYTLGRAAHHLLLGEDAFSTLFIMRPAELDGAAWQGNRTVCKAWLKAQAAVGRTVLMPSQIEQIRGMAKSLAANPLVAAGILNGDIEQSLIWRDKKTGVYLKSRPDAIPNDSGDFADLKTSVSVGWDLDRDVSKYRYDVQAALTKWAAKEVLGREMESFNLVFVEKKPPHSVDIISLSKEDIEEAEKDLRCAVDTFAWCVANDNWFGPSGTQSDARYVHISEFARKNAEFRRDFLKREIERAAAATDMAEQYLGAG